MRKYEGNECRIICVYFSPKSCILSYIITREIFHHFTSFQIYWSVLSTGDLSSFISLAIVFIFRIFCRARAWVNKRNNYGNNPPPVESNYLLVFHNPPKHSRPYILHLDCIISTIFHLVKFMFLSRL